MAGPARTVAVFPDPMTLAGRAADLFEQVSASAADRCAVALSGGRTPKAMLERLSTHRIDWPIVHFFWSDERCVPPDHPESNYKTAADALLTRVPVPPANIHRIKGELPPREAASEYRRELRAFFGASPPRFDLVFLGLGTDGHTASLFPGSPALSDASGEMAVENPAPPGAPAPWRVTLTYAGIAAGRRIVFLVEGASKAEILARVLEDPTDTRALPAQGVAPADGELLWLVDAAAASRLRTTQVIR